MRFSVWGALLLACASAAFFFSPAPPSPTWMERGPRSSGRVSAIVATDISHLWVASPGGGVWKTVNGWSLREA